MGDPEQPEQLEGENIKTPEELKLEEAIRENERDITKATNNDSRVQEAENSGKRGLDSYSDMWDRTYRRISMQRWDSFIFLNPESFFHRDKNKEIEKAYQRKEKREQENMKQDTN